MFLTHVQQSVTRLLSAHAYFAGTDGQPVIPVIAGNDKGLLSKASAAMSKVGLCVIVHPLGGDYDDNSTTTPCFRDARFTCRIRENQIINRGASGSGQPAELVGEVIAVILKNHRPTASDGTTFLGGGGIIVKALEMGEDIQPGIDAWDLIWTYSGGVIHEAVRLDFSADPLPGSATGNGN